MRILDHVYDDMVVEKLTTKVILPEGAKSVKLKTPFPVNRLADYKHYTYLDTMGRIVVTMQSKNLLENHIQDFELGYKYSKILMLQEPILVIIACFTIYVVGIFYSRLDLSIYKKNNWCFRKSNKKKVGWMQLCSLFVALFVQCFHYKCVKRRQLGIFYSSVSGLLWVEFFSGGSLEMAK